MAQRMIATGWLPVYLVAVSLMLTAKDAPTSRSLRMMTPRLSPAAVRKFTRRDDEPRPRWVYAERYAHAVTRGRDSYFVHLPATPRRLLRAVSDASMARPVPSRLLWSAVAAWVIADAAQGVVGPSLLWALLDEVAHGSIAATCALWLVPRWGFGPVVAAVLSATLIDVDHAIAGGSLAPERMMQLYARPPTHSILAALALAITTGVLGGARIGHAVGVGMVTHILRDATAPPGVPLLAPVLEDQHVILPFWIVPATVVGFSILHAAIASDLLRLAGRVRRRRSGARPWSAGR